jgi:hypothetical protein
MPTIFAAAARKVTADKNKIHAAWAFGLIPADAAIDHEAVIRGALSVNLRGAAGSCALRPPHCLLPENKCPDSAKCTEGKILRTAS